jgi:Family of unknown function (DUF6173)
MGEHAMSNEIRTSVEAMEAAVLPRARVARACDDLGKTAEAQPLPDDIARQPVEEKSPAQWAYERLILYVKNFEEQLDDQHEVAMGFAGGEAGVLTIEGIGYFAPDIVTFYGREEDGTRTQLIQHVTQLNVMLRAMPRTDEAEEPRRIGFRLVAELADRPAMKRKGATRAQSRSRTRDRG